MELKSTWDILSTIDCTKHIEKKNGLNYLSWAWAWGITKKNFSTANYEVVYFDGKPYLFDENLGYLVQTKVTINGETIGMQLPVMDGANKAQKHIKYEYGKYNKTCEAASMFDINTAIMRCLTKNLAMFGLGHYIYAGEDIPMQLESVEEANNKVAADIQLIKSCQKLEDLATLWKSGTLQQMANKEVIKAKEEQKLKLTEK